jgi:ATP-dependent helicase/nuclease subunit A
MPESVLADQRRASDPAHSVWVSANAGSGKTHVLTARVLRLLLTGVAPQEILCLTYTKAAAAEMRKRVGERLGRWALLDDLALSRELRELDGEAAGAGKLLRARSLFAHALETPGGLRIQTIHAFCESVLHRFPKEAGVPFDFTVIEDFEREAMLLEARETVLADGIRGGANAEAVETLLGLMSDFGIAEAMTQALNRQPDLKQILEHKAEAKGELRKLLDEPRSVDSIVAEIATGYGPTVEDHAALFEVAKPDRGGSGFVDRLAGIDPARPETDAILDAFLTQTERKVRKLLLTKAIASLVPDVADRLATERDRLETLLEHLGRAEMLARSEALLDLLGSIVDLYESRKRERSLLDFDDLVEQVGKLLNDTSRGEWVRYKLDANLSHILVDEGQDTNPRQWTVIRALIGEFFAGDGAVQRPRTLFAVGDQKQSIFSFQGADPEEFVHIGREVHFTALTVQLEVRRVPLHTSFRTLPNILGAVDKVFSREDLRAGMLEGDVAHATVRAEGGGLVTLWPPVRGEAADDDTDDWPQEISDSQTKNGPRLAAEGIAAEIKQWLDEGRMLGPRKRAVTANDILILVQVRSVLFHEIIRALTQKGIPTPGADRLPVTTHIAALDLMALGDVLSNTSDDLQLAAVLRSPLFDVSEDDLFALAQPRDARTTSLWAAMKTSAIPSVVAANRQLRAWRARLDFDRPFNFYSDVLYAGGGLKRLRGRLGAEVDDVVAEFLELALQHEQSAQPSLLGFLAELRRRDVTIKRELADAGSGVRVMTVHGAKGLEAPIVILADASITEAGRDRRAVYLLPDLPLFFHGSSKANHTGETEGYRAEADAAQQREYWRKLYVAMTRAEDELYVTGYLTKKGSTKGSWYEAVDQALRPEALAVPGREGEEPVLIYPAGAAVPAERGRISPELAAAVASALPELPHYALRRIVRPSLAFDEAAVTTPDAALVTDAETVVERRDPDRARLNGIALHALLHHLARIEPGQWDAVSAKAMPVLLPDHPADHAAVIAKAHAILTRPDLAGLFGPNSRGEVPILAKGTRKGQPITIAGRIDRLVVEPGRVWIVDYKSDARTPDDGAPVPPAYRTQLGLYALIAGQLFGGRQVAASIFWTGPESLTNLDKKDLHDAVDGFTIG